MALLPTLRLLLLTAPPLLAGACGDADIPPTDAGAPVVQPSDEPDFRGRVYERDLVFLGFPGDSVLLVPWLTEARTLPDGVARRARAHLGRGRTWQTFHDTAWTDPPMRGPWRLLPHGPVGLVVGAGDALDALVYDAPGRSVELDLGRPLAEWGGPRGEVLRVGEGVLTVGDRRVLGLVADVARARGTGDPAHGDWGVLVSGDTLQLVVQERAGGSQAGTDRWRAWARVDLRELQWPEVDAVWTGRRAWDPARRDVPTGWRLGGETDTPTGRLEVVAAELRAGESADPQAPLEGLLQVEGNVAIEGRTYRVRGFVRHLQGAPAGGRP